MEDHVTHERDAGGTIHQDHVPGRVPRRVLHLQGPVAEDEGVAVCPLAVGLRERGHGQPEVGRLLRRGAIEGQVVGVEVDGHLRKGHPHDRDSLDVIQVGMGQEDRAELDSLAHGDPNQLLGCGARIHRHGGARRSAHGQVAVLAEGAAGEGVDPH